MCSSLPEIDLVTDSHVHTRFCQHARGEMEDYVQAAIAAKLHGICFLEHMETGISWKKRTWLNEDDFKAYVSEGTRLQQCYAGKLNIELGIELGYNSKHRSTILKRLRSANWDRIGISCHFLKTDTGFLNLFSRDQENIDMVRQFGPESLLTQYFNELIEAVSVLPASHLCHLDGALRHLPELNITQSHYKQIDILLRKVKEKKMTLEINTSGIKHRGYPYPAPRILAQAIGYGIPLCASSDAHRPEDVAKNFSQIQTYIKTALA